MARYQVPQDPRRPNPGPTAEADNQPRAPIPWRWLGLGVLVTILGIAASIGLLNAFLVKEPLQVTPINPTVLVLTAPPSAVPTQTPLLPTPTSIPTLTPIPTPDLAVAPEEITPGYYAVVVNTEGFGVTVRGGPSTNNVPLVVANEGTILFVFGGPAEGNGFLWWQVRLDDGTEGWAAADFLAPAVAPDN